MIGQSTANAWDWMEESHMTELLSFPLHVFSHVESNAPGKSVNAYSNSHTRFLKEKIQHTVLMQW